MGAVLVVGGFFGDEGKGKVVAYLALRDKPRLAVRVGSVNAGHTVVINGSTYKLRIVPSAFVNRDTLLGVAAGALLRLDVFFDEVRRLGVEDRIFVDPNTGIITPEHVERERSSAHLRTHIGSTLQGVGEAMVDRVRRVLKLARDVPELHRYLKPISDLANDLIDKGETVLIEGTQGTYLSLIHGTYPYVTSRDTTAAALLSEVGIGPKRVSEVIVVFKAFVTRVGNGPLPGELPLEEVERRGWIERASVTGRLRRAAPFNTELAKRAIRLNSATQVALTKIDALFPEARGVRSWDKLPYNAKKWIEELEQELKVPITLIGTGEEVRDIVDRRGEIL